MLAGACSTHVLHGPRHPEPSDAQDRDQSQYDDRRPHRRRNPHALHPPHQGPANRAHHHRKTQSARARPAPDRATNTRPQRRSPKCPTSSLYLAFAADRNFQTWIPRSRFNARRSRGPPWPLRGNTDATHAILISSFVLRDEISVTSKQKSGEQRKGPSPVIRPMTQKTATVSARIALPPPPSQTLAGPRVSSRAASTAPRATSARGPPPWGAPRTRTHRSVPVPPAPAGASRLPRTVPCPTPLTPA